AEGAVGVEDGGRVVVDAGGPALEDGGDHGDAGLARDAPQRLGGRPRDWLGEVEAGRVLALAEVGRAEELGGTDDSGATTRSLAYPCRCGREVLGRIGGAAHLDETDAECRRRRAHARTLPACRRGVNRRCGFRATRAPLVTAVAAR